jgi:hypothetical protein
LVKRVDCSAGLLEEKAHAKGATDLIDAVVGSVERQNWQLLHCCAPVEN